MELQQPPAVPPVARLPPRKKRQRPRAARACDRCREKKYRCDEQYPCSHCKKSQLECVYQGNVHRGSSRYVIDLENRVVDLTAKLRGEADSTTQGSPQSQRPAPEGVTRNTRSSMPQDLGSPRDGISYDNDSGTTDDNEHEVREFNHHTNAVEFHGSTSSAAFIGHLQKANEPTRPVSPSTGETPYSVVSTLHNPSFSPSASGAAESGAFHEQNYYFDQAYTFMSGYFENIHFIHPFVDKDAFISRSQNLWMNRAQPPPSFIALYLSVLSFGSLVRVWDEERLGGLTRFEWSRKLFSEAQTYLNHLQFSNDLETVQCLYLMAKICQNELNPNLAYMYLGLAVRTCLSAGFNREDQNPRGQQWMNDRPSWISKTWWGLYSLEIEMSVSVGRPDTLGLDKYHNRAIPPRDDSLYAIIPWMVDFAQIMRKVSVQMYHSRITLHEKLHRALQIEAEMDRWLGQLPDQIKPDIWGAPTSGSALRDPKWARRQRLVLGLRYCNVKTLLFRPFLSNSIHKLEETPTEYREPISKCLDSATKSIEVVHNTYRAHAFFRCWWYNTTYVMFATATLLLPLSKLGMRSDLAPQLLQSVEMAVEILEAMDESVVARKSVGIIKHYLRGLRASSTRSEPDIGNDTGGNYETAFLPTDTGSNQPGVDIPEWAYGFVFPDYSFEGIARLFDDLGALPALNG